MTVIVVTRNNRRNPIYLFTQSKATYLMWMSANKLNTPPFDAHVSGGRGPAPPEAESKPIVLQD